jgi:hypothetical protein
LRWSAINGYGGEHGIQKEQHRQDWNGSRSVEEVSALNNLEERRFEFGSAQSSCGLGSVNDPDAMATNTKYRRPAAAELEFVRITQLSQLLSAMSKPVDIRCVVYTSVFGRQFHRLFA